MNLAEAFEIREREVISLVGGGGKTTLLFGLGNELAQQRTGILLTTTTKIWEPDLSPAYTVLLSRDLSVLKRRIAENLGRFSFLVIAEQKLENQKLDGIDPQWVEELFELPGISTVIVEADGAAGRSLKAPREGEPVIPSSTSLLIPIVGLDILGCPLTEPFVFRSEIASRLLHLPVGSEVTEEVIARLMKELIRKKPPNSRVIPFINKVDHPDWQGEARALAERLVEVGSPDISKVVIGQMQGDRWMQEVRALSTSN
jgi:probable selenium-dependent hydroxylase accessory protein YqeC